MKIGILTLPLHTNYGGILQAYALQIVLKRMGHDVCIIEKRKSPLRLPLLKAPFVYGKRMIKKMIGSPIPIFYEQKTNREKPIIQQNTNKFICRYIKRKFVDDFSEIKETDFDAIVVGSDQVWRPKYFRDGIEHAYLDFTNGWNIKRIAYAASFGTDEWEYTPKQTKRCGELLKHFDAVSVREDSSVDLCYLHFGVTAQNVLDPTMLLTKEEYIQLFENTYTLKSEGDLLYYILDETPEKMDLIDNIAAEKKMIPFRVNSKVKNINAPLEERIQLPVEQWIRGFYDAKYIVTDSFHACVFSIIFNKPFTVIANVDRGMSRLSSLLRMFNLSERLNTNMLSHVLDCSIDWLDINRLLIEKRKMSYDFLNKING